MANGPSFRVRIAESDIVKNEAFANRLRERTRIVRGKNFRLNLEEREEIVEVERLTGGGREARQKPFEEGAQTSERTCEKGEIADRELACQRTPGYVCVSQIIADGADCSEEAAPAGAPYREFAICRIKIIGKPDVAINQEAVETEDFHLLGGLNAGGGLPNIVEFSPLRRSTEIERVTLRIEMRLSKERGNQRQ